MRRLWIPLLGLSLLAPARPASADVAQVSRAVVRLYVTSQGWNLAQPWTKTLRGSRSVRASSSPRDR